MNRNARRQAYERKRTPEAIEPLTEADRNLAREWSGPERTDLELAPWASDTKQADLQRAVDQRREYR
ncbi:MAG: hypothetical protein JWQ03_622 [Variovorax sp.]|nr:hypothetical protein [Variovorax sp.]